MEKIKINVNRAKFTEEEISQSMNFNKVISAVPAPPKTFFKTPVFYASVIITAIIITVVVTQFIKTKEQPFINPPLKGVNIAYSEYKVDNAKDTVLEYKTGSVIYVPKNAFVDKAGNPVNKKAILKYREMHDPADFFLSGIPMDYDSADIRHPFESAGMIDIAAIDENGNTLYANPKAPITVGMASPQKDDRYNVYYLDTAAHKWKYMGRDTSGKYCKGDTLPVSEEANLKNAPNKSIIKDTIYNNERNPIVERVALNTPVIPRKADSKKYHFKISFSKTDFPEMAVYEKVLFEVDSSEKNFKAEYASTIWENVKLENGTKINDYQVTFSNETDTHSFLVHPVFEKGDYAAALKVYTKKFNEYQQKLKSKVETEKKTQEKKELELTSLNEKREAELRDIHTQQIVWQQRMEAKMKTENTFFRTLQVSNFGVWNCDYPGSLPQGAKLNANFTDENNRQLTLDKVYLVEKGRNAIFTYYGSGYNNFQFNPAAENILWAVTNDNKIAIFRSEEFAAVGKTSGSYTFKLTTSDRTFADDKEVKTFLNI